MNWRSSTDEDKVVRSPSTVKANEDYRFNVVNFFISQWKNLIIGILLILNVYQYLDSSILSKNFLGTKVVCESQINQLTNKNNKLLGKLKATEKSVIEERRKHEQTKRKLDILIKDINNRP